MSAPYIPDSAPFSPEQREWLNGFLAGMFSSQEAPAGVAVAETKGRIPILFGSQSGNAEGLADRFSEMLVAAGFDAPSINMEDHGDLDLSKETHLLVISSTWGEGDPPDNAAEFWEELSSDDHPTLETLNFAVCGLGDSNYLDFCGIGKKFDARLAELGGNRLAERVDCDVDFEEPAEAWFHTILSGLGSAAVTSQKTETSSFNKKNPFPAPLLTNQELNSSDSPRDTRHFELCLKGSGLEYEVGDALGVLPENCSGVVDDLIAALGYDADEIVPVVSGDVALRQAFIRDLAITLPNKNFLTAYAAATGNEPDSDYLWGREIIDLIEDAPGWRPPATEFVALLGKLNPRLYSISSSPRAHPGEVHLTVAAVRYEAHGRTRKGVCSTFLADRVNGDGAGVFVQVSKGFRLPEDPSIPIIMVGPGTGIAPFRAFLEDRIATEASGENWLFFGNPHEETDFLYRDELTAMQNSGGLHRLDLAWSRDGDKKVYVQHKMAEAAAELWAWLENGAHFYVCGDAKRMAKDVDTTLHEIIEEHGGVDAVEYVSGMKKAKRYQRDVY